MRKVGRSGTQSKTKRPVTPKGPSQHEINEVLNSYQAKQFELAITKAQELTHKYPQNPFGWKALGALLKTLGRIEESLDPMQKSVLLAPNDPEAHSNLGVTFKGLGRLHDAEASYRNSIRLKPDHAEAHNNLGSTLKNLGRLIEAEMSYREAIRHKPDYAEAHSNLANVLNDLGRPEEAEASCLLSIQLNKDNADAYNNLGNALKELGRFAEAEVRYRESIHLQPDNELVYGNLGVTLNQLGRLRESEAVIREAIRIKPDFARAYNNLSLTLKDLGRLTEAEATYREAIRLKPDLPEVHSNLGVTLSELGRLTEAEASYREALRLKPDYAEAHSNLLFSLNYVESLSPEAALVEAQFYGAQVSARATPKFSTWATDANATTLRIGFVSGDLRNHPVGYFIEGLIKYLDQRQFEIYAFPTSPKADDLTDRIRPHFRGWLPIYGKTDFEAAKVIHDQGIHVLIDLSGHTAHNRLPVFAYKPAPVQVSWLGYFATTGLPEMDYFLGDPVMSPSNEQHHFTEKICNLPETWLCLTPPSQPVPILPLPAKTNGYVTFGCFGNLSKVNDQVIRLWAKILNRIPSSKLFLKAKQFADAQVVSFVQNQFAAYGISNERLIFEGPSSRRTYFEAYNRIDLVLDTFPYPGGTTSVDALWMGTPVLTLKGDRFLSHLGESIAVNAGQGEWIAQDEEDYVRKAEAFALDPRNFEEVRSGLRDRVMQTPLFDTQRFARAFGEALRGMWNNQK